MTMYDKWSNTMVFPSPSLTTSMSWPSVRDVILSGDPLAMEELLTPNQKLQLEATRERFPDVKVGFYTSLAELQPSKKKTKKEKNKLKGRSGFDALEKKVQKLHDGLNQVLNDIRDLK